MAWLCIGLSLEVFLGGLLLPDRGVWQQWMKEGTWGLEKQEYEQQHDRDWQEKKESDAVRVGVVWHWNVEASRNKNCLS